MALEFFGDPDKPRQHAPVRLFQGEGFDLRYTIDQLGATAKDPRTIVDLSGSQFDLSFWKRPAGMAYESSTSSLVHAIPWASGVSFETNGSDGVILVSQIQADPILCGSFVARLMRTTGGTQKTLAYGEFAFI